SAAASVLILIGVAWLLWLRPAPADNPLSYTAQLRPIAPVQAPTLTPAAPPTLRQTSSPSIHHAKPLTLRPSIYPTTSPSEYPDIPITEPTNIRYAETVLSQPSDLSALRTAEAPAARPATDIQAFQERDALSAIDPQKTAKGISHSELRTDNSLSGSKNTRIGLNVGTSFISDNTPNPLFGLSLTIETNRNSAICANTRGDLSILLSQPQNQVMLQFGYGLSYYPVNSLALRLNLGAFLLFGDFDLGLRLSTEADYHLTDRLSLSLGYQYCPPGIVSGNSRHAALFSVGCIID
ncbi:MAG: hypothetical protein J5641_04925, partial [Bacteroidales bacterium]|nr:hypothetical protein [Bacteroidales bacterium]